MLLLALLTVLVSSQDVIVRSGRAPIADPWTQSVRATCGALTLEIAGYGVARPLTRIAEVRVDNRPVVGAAQLVADLSSHSAVYRLEMFCSDDGRFTARINRGQAQQDGSVQYYVGVATISDGRLVSYTGLEPSDASTFWFR